MQADMTRAKKCCYCVMAFTSAWLFAFTYCAVASSFFKWDDDKTYTSPKYFQWPTPAPQLKQSTAQLHQWTLNQTIARREMPFKKSDLKRETAPLTIARDLRANLAGVAFIVMLYIVCQERKMQSLQLGVKNFKVRDECAVSV
jgi:hypothetical protein